MNFNNEKPYINPLTRNSIEGSFKLNSVSSERSVATNRYHRMAAIQVKTDSFLSRLTGKWLFYEIMYCKLTDHLSWLSTSKGSLYWALTWFRMTCCSILDSEEHQGDLPSASGWQSQSGFFILLPDWEPLIPCQLRNPIPVTPHSNDEPLRSLHWISPAVPWLPQRTPFKYGTQDKGSIPYPEKKPYKYCNC